MLGHVIIKKWSAVAGLTVGNLSFIDTDEDSRQNVATCGSGIILDCSETVISDPDFTMAT